MSLILAALLGYLLGSVPYGLILTKAAGLGDIRAIGSGNIGATNVLRTGNKPLAAATLALDVLKGAAALLIARGLWGEDAALIAGVDDVWEVCLLKFSMEMIQKSAGENVAEWKRRGLA
jgi:glycerol-3-phosphate acyltransferase PlsY